MIRITTPDVEKLKRIVQETIGGIQTQKRVTVGIHESDSSRDDQGATNAQIGATHEFGAQNIPARPWLVPGVESGNQEYIETMRHELSNGASPESLLPMLGVLAVSNVQQYMTELRSPPNAQSTIERKKSSNPLIDTGELKSSVTFEVADK